MGEYINSGQENANYYLGFRAYELFLGRYGLYRV